MIDPAVYAYVQIGACVKSIYFVQCVIVNMYEAFEGQRGGDD